MKRTLLRFYYVNWKDEDHEYVIEPTGAGIAVDDYNFGRPVLHGNVVFKDGKPPDRQPTRRTFVLVKMRNVREVDQTDA